MVEQGMKSSRCRFDSCTGHNNLGVAMFKAFTVSYNDLPDDVNRDAFETGGVEEYYEDYLVI